MIARFSKCLLQRRLLKKSPFSTQNNCRLGLSQTEFYNENGYMVFPNLISDESIDELRSHTSEMIKEFNVKDNLSFFQTNTSRGADFIHTGDKIHFFFEPEAIDPKTKALKVEKQHAFNKIGHAMHDLDPIYKKFSHQEIFKSILEGIGYLNPTLCQSMYIFKSPKIGQEVQPHTDNTYLITKPLSCCGIWVALDDAKITNGCLWGVPGSHKQKTTHFMKRNKEATETYFEEKDPNKTKSYDVENGVPLEVPKGSVVVLHGDFVHYSKDNRSNERRHAYTMHFVETEKTVWDEGNWLQRGGNLPFRSYFKEV